MLKRLIYALIGHRLLSKSYYPNLVEDYHIWKRTFFDPVGAKFISQRAQTILDGGKKLFSSPSDSFLSVNRIQNNLIFSLKNGDNAWIVREI